MISREIKLSCPVSPVVIPAVQIADMTSKSVSPSGKPCMPACHVHEQFSVEKIAALKKQYPDAAILVHPECKGAVAKLADKVGSTAGLLKYAIASDKKDFIVATESGILHEMRKQCPEKNFIPAPPEDSTCACNECNFMRLNTMEKLYNTLKYEWPEVTVDEAIAQEAVKPIKKMLEISEKLGL